MPTERHALSYFLFNGPRKQMNLVSRKRIYIIISFGCIFLSVHVTNGHHFLYKNNKMQSQNNRASKHHLHKLRERQMSKCSSIFKIYV